jgi:hypothetical protein
MTTIAEPRVLPDRPTIIVPADPHKPVRLEALPADPDAQLAWARELVGGWVEQAVYEPDAAVLVNEDGKQLRLPVNRRATYYVRQQSTAARQHAAAGRDWPPDYFLVGDVVIVGLEHSAERDSWRGVPARLAQAFGLDS